MRRNVLGASLAAVVALLACTDGTGPNDAGRSRIAAVPDGQPHLVQMARAGTPQFSATAGSSHGEVLLVESPLTSEGVNNEIALDTYRVSFWAVRGQTRYLQINYVDASGSGDVYPFMRLTVREPMRRPDGSWIWWGDSVLVTASVDPETVQAEFGPAGLEFAWDSPAELKLWYGGANGDLNGDGVVDQVDTSIQQQFLGVFYRETAADPWTAIPSYHAWWAEYFRSSLEHFSGYAVAW